MNNRRQAQKVQIVKTGARPDKRATSSWRWILRMEMILEDQTVLNAN